MGWEQQGGFCGRLPKTRLPPDAIYEGTDAGLLGSGAAVDGEALTSDGAGGAEWTGPYQLLSQKAQADGYASLDGSGKVPTSQISEATGILETGGPTALAIGAIPDGYIPKRVGSTLVGVDPATFTGAVSVTVSDAVTAAPTDVLTVKHVTSGTPAAGYGTSILFAGEDAAGNADDLGRFGFIWTDATSASEDSAMVVLLRSGGAAPAETWRVGAGIMDPAITSVGPGAAGVTGNARGVGAIDLQVHRALATQVASGARSRVLGTNCTATGTGAHAQGYQNQALAESSTILGGAYHVVYAGAEMSTIAGGQACYILGSCVESFIGAGRSNYAGGRFTGILAGAGSYVTNHAAMAHGSGTFSAAGDAQQEWMVLRGITTDATPVELLAGINGFQTYRFNLVDNSTYSFTIVITARRTDAGNESASYQRFLGMDRNAGVTALVGSMTGTDIEDQPAWNVVITASDANDALTVTVTGEAGKNIRWVAAIHSVRVTG